MSVGLAMNGSDGSCSRKNGMGHFESEQEVAQEPIRVLTKRYHVEPARALSAPRR